MYPISQNMQSPKWVSFMVFLALGVFALFMFVSISVMSLAHILLFIPVLWGINHFTKNHLWRLFPLSAWCLVGIFFIGLLSLGLQGGDLLHPWKKWMHLKYYFFAAFSLTVVPGVIQFYLSEKKRSLLLKFFLVSTSVASISGLIGLFMGWNPLRNSLPCHPTRACGLNGMYMSYGYGISFFMVVLTSLLVHGKEWRSWVSPVWIRVAWIINFFGFIFSFARGGWVCFLAAIPVLLWQWKPKKFWRWSFIFLVMLGISVLPFYKKLESIFFSPQRIESNYIRYSNYHAAWMAFLEHPIVGVGPRNFEEIIGDIKLKYHLPYADFHGHAHNNFLELLAATGILGLLCILFFHIFWFLELFKRKDLVARTLLPFPVALFVAGQFQYTLGDAQNLFFTTVIYFLSQVPFILRKDSREFL